MYTVAEESGPAGRSNPKTPAGETRSKDGVGRATGRGRNEWFALLDAWGAAGRPYREIAGWLTGEHGISDWWAQKLIVEYEQARGVREPGVRPDGTFTVGTSKTVAVPVDRLYAAVMDPAQRERWLPGAEMHERTTRPGRSARFDWGDGATRVNMTFAATGDAGSQVAVEHERLPNARAGEAALESWRQRLAALKAFLEG